MSDTVRCSECGEDYEAVHGCEYAPQPEPPEVAFIREMMAIDKARNGGMAEDYCETGNCRHWDSDDDCCKLLWCCSDAVIAWECWLEARQEASND